MERIELLQHIKTELMYDTFGTAEQEQIDAFLDGTLEQVAIPAKSKRLYTAIFYMLEQELDRGEKELAERGFSLFYSIYPDTVKQYYRYRNDKFYIFWKFHMPTACARENILEEIRQCVSYGGGSLYEFFNNWKSGQNKPLSQFHDMTHLYNYYPDAVGRLEMEKEDLPTIKVGNLVLCVCECIWYHGDEEKRAAALAKLEKWVYGILKQVFCIQRFLKDARGVTFSEEAKEFADRAEQIDIFDEKNLLFQAVFNICQYTYHWSPLLFEAYKFCLLQINPLSYLRWYHETPEGLCKTYQELAFPSAWEVKVYAELLLFKGTDANGEMLIKWLRKDRAVFLEACRICKQEKNLSWLMLLAVLLKEGDAAAKEETCKEAGEKFVAELKGLEAAIRHKKEDFGLRRKDKTAADFCLLLEKDMPLGELELTMQRYIQGVNPLLNCAAALFYYTDFARNFYCLAVSSPMVSWTGDYMEKFIRFQKWFGGQKENQFERLAQYLPVPQVIMANLYRYQIDNDSLAAYRAFLKNHLEESREVLQKMLKENDDKICNYIAALYGGEMILSIEVIVPVLEHKLKTVVNTVENFLADKLEAREFVMPYVKSKNKNAKEAAARLIRLYDSEKVTAEMGLLKTPEEMAAYVETRYDKTNDKKIPYLEQIDLSWVRDCNQNAASPYLLRYILSEYLLLKDVHTLQNCNMTAKFLDRGDLQKALAELYELWVADGADTKKKNILLPYAIFANDTQITELKKQIDTWAENSRGALAAFAVQAMALNGGNIALLLVDGIAAKYKNKQVRGAAAAALEQAAQELHITKDELADIIVPDLGFDQGRKRVFSYGGRQFLATLNQKLEVTLSDEKGKAIKTLPKPNQGDNPALAEECKEGLKLLKKQLKTVVATQKNRLEQALITGRIWPVDKWRRLFVENPIMNGFAIGLIWQEYTKDGKAVGSFRYMEDGSFNTCEEEEYQLGEGTDIALLHPLDIGEDAIALWKEQLSDYEIVQPFLQLDLPIYSLLEEEKGKGKIDRFVGKKVYFGAIRSVMEKYDWKKTSIVDAGGYDGYYFEDPTRQIGVQLMFDYLFVGMAVDEVVTMGQMEFYKCGTIQYGSYQYDEVNEGNRILPEDVPEKLASFALMVGEVIGQKEIS